MDIKLELYKIFYHVVRSGSISGAARELYITQPAVSQAIRQLESALGGTLLFRTSKGIHLTPEGQVLYHYVSQGYSLLRTAENKFAEVMNLDAGEIRIGASDMGLKFFLLPYLEEFHREYPKIRIKVSSGPSPQTIAALKQGYIDIGLSSLPIDQEEDLDIIETMEIQDCFVANYRYGSLAQKKVSVHELEQHPIILLQPDTSTRRYLDDYFAAQGVSVTPEIELATSDLLVQFARRGLGISCVVRNFAEDHLRDGSLFELDLSEPIPARHIGIIKLTRVPLSPAARKFVELVNTQNI